MNEHQSDRNWPIAYFRHAAGSTEELGISIRISGDLTEKEKSFAGDALYKLFAEIEAERNRNNHAKVESGKLECAELASCFRESGIQPIYVEKIPNEYCTLPCCVTRPWLIVTTRLGRIKIDWRKRVINIDWSNSALDIDADELFPNEDVTKGKYLIHTWGREKAIEYLSWLIVSYDNRVATKGSLVE